MARLGSIVYKYTRWAKKSFLPNGDDYRLLHFQRAFAHLTGKIHFSEDLIQKYGLRPKVYLGRQLLFDVDHVATYLYDKAIHPRFFADALHTIARHSTRLNPPPPENPPLKCVQLRNLRRDQIAIALKRGAFTRADLGENFEAFGTKPVKDRLEILEKLGVIVLNPGTSLPTPPTTPAPQNTAAILPPLLALMQRKGNSK